MFCALDENVNKKHDKGIHDSGTKDHFCSVNQCCSPNGSKTKRCSNQVYKSSKHCEEHYQKALELYLNYKKLCETAYKLVINKPIENRRKKISYLRRCHNLLVKAYNARLIHRNYAFVPECYDFGHNLQFDIIQERIDKCKEELDSLRLTEKTNVLWNLQDDVDNDNVDDVDNDNVDDVDNLDHQDEKSSDAKSPPYTVYTADTLEEKREYEEAIKEMKKFNVRRKRDESDKEKMIEKYAKKNKIEMDKKKKLINDMIKAFIALVGNKSIIATDVHVYANSYLGCGIFGLIEKLFSLDYFDDDYEPETCPNCDCDNLAVHYFQLFEKQNLTPNFAAMVDQFCSCQLGFFYHEIILSNLKKIKPIVDDFVKLIEYELKNKKKLIKTKENTDSVRNNLIKVLMMNLEIGWSDLLDRLVLSKGKPKSLCEKKSKRISIRRLNDRAYINFINKMKENGELSDLSDGDVDSDISDSNNEFDSKLDDK